MKKEETKTWDRRTGTNNRTRTGNWRGSSTAVESSSEHRKKGQRQIKGQKQPPLAVMNEECHDITRALNKRALLELVKKCSTLSSPYVHWSQKCSTLLLIGPPCLTNCLNQFRHEKRAETNQGRETTLSWPQGSRKEWLLELVSPLWTENVVLFCGLVLPVSYSQLRPTILLS